MYTVMLFHDIFKSCAKSADFVSLSGALGFLSDRVARGGEYESAMIYHTSNLILMYSRTGREL
jgi:hypothetical protein